jgi:thiol:disulfide interchange protein
MNRVVLLKVVVQDFKAPILTALNIQGLPQFWVYNAQGKLTKKLTDRFTEGDIDAAIREALRVRSL